MPFRTLRRILLAASVAHGALAATCAHSQTGDVPIWRQIDDNSVDVVTGMLDFSLPLGSIGPQDGGLSLELQSNPLYWFDNYSGKITRSGNDLKSTLTVTAGKIKRTFDETNITCDSTGCWHKPLQNSGYRLLSTSPSGKVMVAPDGTRYSYLGPFSNLSSIEMPNGETITNTYKSASQPNLVNKARKQSTTSNRGYQIKYHYLSDLTSVTPTNGAPSDIMIDKITFINNKIEYCDPSANECALSFAWPTIYITYSSVGSAVYNENSTVTISDATSKGKILTFSANTSIKSIRGLGNPDDNLDITYNGAIVSTVKKNGNSWLYSRSVAAPNTTMSITNPMSGTIVYSSTTATGRVNSVRDELNRTTSFEYDSSGRLTAMTQPEGNREERSYDDRGNVTMVIRRPKPGSTLPVSQISSTFPATCDNNKTCNLPTTTTDGRNNVTDYAYDPNSGQPTSIKYPAAANGIRRETRSTYLPQFAWYKNSGGAITQSPSAIYMLSESSECQTLAACTGTIDEIKTTILYEGSLTGLGGNALPTSISKLAGDGSLVATTSMGYDPIGNQMTVDGPLPGNSDLTRFRFDAARQLIGAVSPDPDGPGPLQSRATRYTYNLNGDPTRVEVGTIADQTDTSWNTFVSLKDLQLQYDTHGRKSGEILSSGGTVYNFKQYSYGVLGKVECVALRMDPAQWSGQTDACLPQITNSNGPDRVTKSSYDVAGQLVELTDGYGTSAQRSQRKMTYSANGSLLTAKDGNSNLTTYEYDSLDRLSKTRFPVPLIGANASSPTDYEQLGYDLGGNVISRRLRDGQMIYYGYDNLNRLTSKDRPNTTYWETDLSYAYDLMGRLTSASDSNGHVYSFSYDALGRKTTESSNWYGTMTSGYDLAGRRTTLTYPDNFFVNYDYLVTGEMAAVRENGAASGAGVLASFNYDDLGRRVGMVRGNGTVTSYAFDAASRLSAFTHDLGGTAQDVNVSFSYNPASQIISATRSNESYGFSQSVNVNRGYGINGLNQYTSAGSVSMGYDARGNLNNSGGSAYGYNVDNQLATGPGSYFAYDPLGRLFNEAGVNNISMLYDGDEVVLERDQASWSIRRRYVYGPDTDEPIVWYEGPGTADRRWLHADERGSVIAVTNASGGTIAINSYDEYGIPGSGNIGRFQYTGQMWLPDLGMYSYKARIYSPTLGRFMQTDPIGYGDGMNWYAYTQDDPVNGTDPTGLVGPAKLESNILSNRDDTIFGPDIVVPARHIAANFDNFGHISLPVPILPGNLLTNAFKAAPPKKDCSGPKGRSYSSTDMAGANSIALAATGQSLDVSPLSSEFSRLNNLPNMTPDSGWNYAYTPHATGGGWEHALPGNSGMYVKIYKGDTKNSGLNTVTITSKTWSFDHFAEQIDYYGGSNINEQHAKSFMNGLRGGC